MHSPHSTIRLNPARAARCLVSILTVAALLPALSLLGAAPLGAHEVELRPYEVDRLHEIEEQLRPEVQDRLSRGAAWQAYAAEGASWQVRWDESRGVPERLTGSGRAIPGVTRLKGREVEAASRLFVSSQGGPWLQDLELKLERLIPTGRTGGGMGGPGQRDLAPAGSEEAASGWWVHFSQTWHGLPVWGSRLTLRVTKDGRVPVITNRTFKDIEAPIRPAQTAERAVLAAAEGFDTVPVALTPPSLAIVPLRRAGGLEYHLAWRVETRTDEPIGRWTSLVDAGDGTLLTRLNNARDAVVSGRIEGMVEPVTSDGNFQSRPLPYLNLRLFDGWSDTVTTDGNGAFRIETDVTTNRAFEVRLAGPFGRIENQANAGSTPGLGFVAADGGSDSLVIAFQDATSLPSERDCWSHTMTSHDHIKTIEPGFRSLDYPMPIRVELSRTCNAFWDGFGVNFFNEGGGCANSGRIATVIMHEYGHGITDFMYRPFFPSGAMHEGFSDYYACIITNQPIVGQGFRGPGTIIRRIDTNRIFPRDATGEIHNDGLIVASALWDAREALGPALADHLWHFARYGFSDNFDDYFFDYLVEDDDDGNVYNGTPHLGVIAPIFQAHGIGDFGIDVVHTPEPDTENPAKTFEFRARFFSIYPLAAGSVQLHATIDNGGPTQPAETVIEMTAGSEIREYRARLDPQPSGTTITYYLTAEDTTGALVTWPPNTPFHFYVGADVTPPTIAHETLRDQPFDSPLLRVFATITDNLDRGLGLTGLTLHRDGGEAEERPLVLRQGLPGYEAGIPLDGLTLGSQIDYRLSAVDSAAVPNTGHEPASGFHRFQLVRGFGRDFEAGGGGLTATGEFAWGLPLGSGPAAWSGQRVWATSLDSGYSDALTSTLTLAPVDLTDWTRGSLVFRHWFSTEAQFDGGSVLVSTDGGSEWAVLIPDGDYNTPAVASSGYPGWTGRSGDWRLAEFDLSRYVGLPDVRFRFHFQSDESIHGTGWFLDDIQVVERQALSRPLRLTAGSGRANRVPISWALPAGIAEGGRNPVLGYNVYRLGPGDTTPRRLNGDALTTREYLDATAANGTVYSYFASALYSEGESSLTGPKLGFPYTPAYAPTVTGLTATIPFGTVRDTTIAIENSGTGFLQVNGYIANPGQSLDDIRYLFVVGDTAAAPGPPIGAPTEALVEDPRSLGERAAAAAVSHSWPAAARLAAERARTGLIPRGGIVAAWDTLGSDADDASNVIPDLRTFRAAVDSHRVYFGLDAWSPWGASNEFNVVVAISTDGNSTNGFSGGDYLAVVGNIALANFGLPGVLLTANFQPVDFLSPLRFADGDSVAEFGVSLDALNRPAQIVLNVLALDASGQQLIDRMPDRPTNFATLLNRYLLVSAGVPATWRVRLNANGLSGGPHDAVILIDTSDPNRRTSSLPITVTVPPETSVDLAAFLAEPSERGVHLSWRTTAERDQVGFHVYRRALDTEVGGPEPGHTELDDSEFGERLTSTLLTGTGAGVYEYEDTGAKPGRRYEYRVADLSRSGTLTFHAPASVVAGPALPPGVTLPPVTPNPIRATAALRYAVPAAGRVTLQIFGVDGRLVRSLVREDLRAAGWHEDVWDGRSDGGDPAPAGLYLVRLQTDWGTVSRKIVRAR